MPASPFALAALALAVDRLVEWRFGTVGVVGLTLLVFGFKAENPTCSCLGAGLLALLLSSETS